MAEWLGRLLANAPLWIIVLVSGVIVIATAAFYMWSVHFGSRDRTSEWWEQQYGKKKESNHGKK